MKLFFEALVTTRSKLIKTSILIQIIRTRSKSESNTEFNTTQINACWLQKCFNWLISDDSWEDYKLVQLEAGYVIQKAIQESLKKAYSSSESI